MAGKSHLSVIHAPRDLALLVVGQDEVWHLSHPSRQAGTVVQLADGVGGTALPAIRYGTAAGVVRSAWPLHSGGTDVGLDRG